MAKLYVIRHGEPTLLGVFLGRTDPPLSPAGLEQARLALQTLRVDVVFSSPLRRARETAAAIGAPLRVLDSLAEISMGRWEGRTFAEIERETPDFARRKMAAWFETQFPGGESWADFRARVRGALDEILRGPLPAAVVAHGGVNSILAECLTGRAPAGYMQNYCEIHEYDVDGRRDGPA